MKLTPIIRKKVLLLREEGLSYAKIAKRTKISRSSVIKIVKDSKPIEAQTLDAKVLKLCPNPRVLIIYFEDNKDDWHKCVVRADGNYRRGLSIKVKPVETTNEKMYRQV